MVPLRIKPRLGARWLVCLSLTLGGCAIWPATPQVDALLEAPNMPHTVEPTHLKWVEQSDNHCGPAALQMVMTQAGATISYERVVKRVYTPGRQGSLQHDMLAAPSTFGLPSYQVPPTISSLIQLNLDGHSPIVLLNLGLDALPKWHYAVVVGHDLVTRDIILTSGTQALQRLSLKTFELMWARAQYWGMVVAEPDRLPTTITPEEAERATLAFERAQPPAVAATLWRNMAQKWPDRLLPHLGLSHAYMQDQRWEQARDVLLLTTQRFDSAVAWNNLAQTWLALKQPTQAKEAAQRAHARAVSAEPRWISPIEDTLRQIENQ